MEHGGFGSTTAAPIARKIMDAWILGKMPEPPPPAEGEEAEPAIVFESVESAINGAEGAFDQVDGAVDSAPSEGTP